MARASRDPTDDEAEPIAMLGAGRRAVAGRHLPAGAAPPLDEVTVRLGAALHDLLALAHPDLAGPGIARRQEQIALAALELASLGSPSSAREAVNRHSLLARIPEIVRVDRTVRFWLGHRTFVGRTPPGRIMALPSLRRVRVERASRSWLREIGIPAVGRLAFLALNVASPLGEALDPLRLDPPLGWGRILPVLRFPPVARAVAGAAVEIGVDRAGDALAGALYRFAGMHDPPFGLPASEESVAFALRFLAHLVWLDVLYGVDPERARAARPAQSGAGAGARAGRGDHRGGAHPPVAGLARRRPRHGRSRAGLRGPARGPRRAGVGGRFAEAGRGPLHRRFRRRPRHASHRAMMKGHVDVGQ